MKWAPWIAAFTLLGTAVAVAIILVNRLSDREVALIVGALCGAGAATPFGVILGMTIAGQRRRDRELHLPPAPPPTVYVPPQIVMTPPVNPRYPNGALETPRLPRRAYNVIGGNGGEEDGVE